MTNTPMPDNTEHVSVQSGSPEIPLSGDHIHNFLPLYEVHRPPISQSGIKAGCCPRYYFWAERMRLARGKHKSAPFRGQLFHLAHNARLQGRSEDQANMIVARATYDYKESLAGWALENSTPEIAAKYAREADRDSLTAMVMSAIAWDRFPLSKLETMLRTKLEVISFEKELATSIEGCTVGGRGRLDVILRATDWKSRPLIILDYKTGSKGLANYAETASYGVQPQLYRYLAEASGQFDAPVVGCIHLVVTTPKMEPHEPVFDVFKEQVQAWYDGVDDAVGYNDPDTGQLARFKSGPRKGLPKPRWEYAGQSAKWLATGKPPIFATYTQFDRISPTTEFRNILAHANDLATREPLLHLYPRLGEAFGQCLQLYGNPCPYLPLCGSAPHQWEGVVRREYRTRTSEELTADAVQYSDQES